MLIFRSLPITVWNRTKIYRTAKFDLHSTLTNLKTTIGNRNPNANDNISSQTPSGATKQTHPVLVILKRLLKPFSDILEFPDREVTWIPIAFFTGINIIRKEKIDVIFSSSPRHSNHLTTALLKLFTKKRLIIEFRDPWARSPWHDQERASNALERLKHHIIQRLERFAVTSADKIILVTQSMMNEFINYYADIPPDKFCSVYNGFDPTLKDIVNPDRVISADPKPNGKLVFSHVGSLYKRRNPNNLIMAIKALADEGKINQENCEFQFIGIITNDLLYLKELVVKYKLSNIVKFFPPVGYNESFCYMNKSDVLILLQPITKLQLPAKFYDYICFDKPILAIGEKNSEVEKIVNRQFGIFCNNNNTNDIKNSIFRLIKNPNIYHSRIQQNRDQYNFLRSIKAFQNVISH